MRPMTAFALAAALAAFSPLAAAQHLLIAESEEDRISRHRDGNGDGDYNDPGEQQGRFLWSPGSLSSAVTDMRFRMFTFGNPPQTLPTVFWVDTSDDVVGIANDFNGDGDCVDPGESRAFFDFFAATGENTSADSVRFDSTGVLWTNSDVPNGVVASLGALQGIWWLFDQNGDGDAMDAGESGVGLRGNAVVTVPTTTGPFTIDANDFECVAVDGQDRVIAFNVTNRAYYAFKDMNGDRDFEDPGDLRIQFLVPTTLTPGLDPNPDFAAGLLPAVAAANGVVRLNAMEIDTSVTPNAYYFASTAIGPTSGGGQGFVFRGVDGNGDGDVNDAGEVNVYLSGPSNPNLVYPVTAVTGLAFFQGKLYVLSNGGPSGLSCPAGIAFIQDTVYVLEDLNNDGDAEDFGEQTLLLVLAPDGAVTEELEVMPSAAFAPAAPAFVQDFGSGCIGSGGFVPKIGVAGCLPTLGNGSFGVTLSDAVGNGPPLNIARLILGASNATWLGIPLPLDLSIVGLGGCFLLVSMDIGINTSVAGSGAGAGTATIGLPIPPDPFLGGSVVYAQWAVFDPGAAGPPGLTFALSDGVGLGIGTP